MKHSDAFTALTIGFAGISMLLLAFRFAPDDAADAQILNAFAFELFLAMFALAFASFSPLDRATRLGLAPGRIPGEANCVLIAGMLSLSFALDGIYVATGLDESSALAQLESTLTNLRGWSIGAAFASFALAPGIAEEMLCRGLIQRGLMERFRPAAAITIAALVFGMLHVEPVYALLASVLGLYLGAIAYLAGSIRSSIACHVTNNAVAVAATVWGLELETGWLGITVALTASAAALAWTWQYIGGSRDSAANAALDGVGLQRGRQSDDPYGSRPRR